MKKLTLLFTAYILAFPAGSAFAGTVIRDACLRAGRAANPEMCSCIQQVADQRLARKDQKLAATFFRDPHKAQVIRQSDRHAHEVFWTKYKQFGAAASDSCAPYSG